MKRNEAACKQFRDHLAPGQARDHIAAPVFQNEYPLQRSTIRQSESSLAMPRRSVHEDLGRVFAQLVFTKLVVADILITNPMFTDNDAIVAQDSYVVVRGPQTRCRALARPGVADKQVAGAVGAYDADSVQLNRFLLREPVHNQQLIQRILQWS